MIRKLFTLLLSISVAYLASAQSIEEIKADRATYIYGEGRGTTIRQADNYALSAIISQISVNVESDQTLDDKESGANNNLTYESSFESLIKTYSTATLSNTEMIIVENEPDAHIFRYIRRSDIDRIFDSRKDKITNMVKDAQSSLEKRNINDALRYYYWSHTLLKSLRFPNEHYIYDEEGNRNMSSTWIPAQINQIFDNLSIKVSKVESDELVDVEIKYNGEPVGSIDYTCFDGFGWSNIYSAKEGLGIVELRKSVGVDKIQMKVEYAFENEAVVDPEVKTVLEIVEPSVYKKAYSYLSLQPKEEPKEEELMASMSQAKGANTAAIAATDEAEAESGEASYDYPEFSEVVDIEEYQGVIEEVLADIVGNVSQPNEDNFTSRGLAAYNDIIKYGSARLLDSSDVKFYQLGENVYCRNVLMNFSFQTNNRQFAEGVVFEFDAEHKVSNVTFGLSRQAIDDVFSQESWPVQARIILMHFLEGYKTAYGLKQIDYIESIFAEDALIITGSYVREATAAEMANINQKYVKYTRQSKGEYVRNLRNVFSRNEYININFADNSIVKAGKGGEIYGIQIKQEYFSPSYGDTGYLFLMVDLNEITKPVIHVRTWQPEKDPDFGTYGLAHF